MVERRVSNSLVLAAALALLGVFALVQAQADAAEWKERKLSYAPRYVGEVARGYGPLLGISCPTRSFCVAAGQIGMIGASDNPTGGTDAWKSFYGPQGSDYHGPPPPGFIPPPGSPTIKAISCPSATFCVATSANGDIYTSHDPAGGETAWTRADVDGDEYDTHLEGVSCPTVSFCVAVSGGVKTTTTRGRAARSSSRPTPTGGARPGI